MALEWICFFLTNFLLYAILTALGWVFLISPLTDIVYRDLICVVLLGVNLAFFNSRYMGH